jgi:hypothetical protein
MSEVRDRATAKVKKGEVISCSRRTDAPAFKMPWVLAQIRARGVTVGNPRACHEESERDSGHASTGTMVSLAPEDVRCWAWWSKDYAEWIRTWESPETGPLLRQYDAHIFNFTINSERGGPLEPRVATTLDQRLDQLAWLAANFGPENIVLRFDPIVHYRMRNGVATASTSSASTAATSFRIR